MRGHQKNRRAEEERVHVAGQDSTVMRAPVIEAQRIRAQLAQSRHAGATGPPRNRHEGALHLLS
ncbi:uncharacterized protein STAUR_1430 [Stigmatella aurantiaca DW4/3-1]|uniref:Uncharacterized protein n=1 Tax=Stigmatella aurantiaca (strain DW4/3-1) TaxID=378806 RepID=E3FKR6_STIAD|nr:uncharacterized protein STAUR_1430 [Stigmatella aurantiaca DW4/3-1]